MKSTKVISTPLAGHVKLRKNICPITMKEKENMASVPYCLAVGCLMHAMVSTRLDIAHTVGILSRFLENTKKRILRRN